MKRSMRMMNRQGTAAVLSAVLPGLGQIYNGRILWAVFWFIITPGLWIGSGGMLGWICHILSAMQAYSQAGRE
jgi:TM2 domain-containing membrane protein YozV